MPSLNLSFFICIFEGAFLLQNMPSKKQMYDIYEMCSALFNRLAKARMKYLLNTYINIAVFHNLKIINATSV